MAAKTPMLLDRNKGPGYRGARKHLVVQMHRRAVANARHSIRDLRRRLESGEQTLICPLHPDYEGKRAPRSKAKGCRCREIYDARKELSS